MAQDGRWSGRWLLPHHPGAHPADQRSFGEEAMAPRVNRKAYQRTLPRKRVSAGCLLFDEAGRLLIVNPTYKDGWEIPGGAVEANESPLDGCIREIREELG